MNSGSSDILALWFVAGQMVQANALRPCLSRNLLASLLVLLIQHVQVHSVGDVQERDPNELILVVVPDVPVVVQFFGVSGLDVSGAG